MVHLRARNLPSKGVLKEWLFEGEEIKFGDDFALIELEDGTRINIKSNYNGVVTKTINLNSVVRNGSILANIAIGEKEIQKFKNRHFKKEEIPNIVKEDVYIGDQNYEPKLTDVESDADSFSGAVLYNRYNQAITPFSTGEDDIVDSLEKLKKLEERDQIMSQENDKPKDRFAQMRANIRESIKNAPQLKKMGDMTSQELLEASDDKGVNNNLFSTDNAAGVSKFRQLVNARKEKLLQENDFKEIQEPSQEINAMSKTDEKGRPLIMRNIIQARIEKLNNSGGDPSVLEKNIVATKENAILDNQKVKNNIQVDKPKEVEKMKEKNLEVKSDNVFMRQKASDDGDFGVSFGGYVEDEEPTTIDANDLNPYGGVVLPGKKPKELLEEIEHKKNKTYADARISNLYDTSRRWNLIKDRDERNVIKQRREAVERGLNQEHFEFSKKIKDIGMPKEFLKEVPYQDPNTGQMKYITYKETPKGKIEFENWLRAANLYTAYKDEEEYIERTMEVDPQKHKKEINEINHGSILVKTPNNVQKEITSKIEQSDKEFEKASNKETANETIEFLKSQINDLQKTLKEQNQLHAATSRLNQQSHFNGGSDTFSQMMQYMLMQNMIQSMNIKKENNNEIDINELKNLIKSEIQKFTNEFKEEKKNNFSEINYEKDRPDNSVGYLQFETFDENKVIQREKINQNRNQAVKSMILSQNFIPPLSISTEIDMSSILKLKHILKQTQDSIKFTTISFIVKAISIALEEYPKLNSSYDAEANEVVIKKYHNIGLATETSEGLIIPVLKFVEKMSIKEVAADIKDMTSRLRSGKLYNYEADGSTITIANYGNIGAIQATPTIFYPNAAVIGVGKIVKKPVVVDNEKLAIKAMMNMSLTIDQRIIDAAEAGQFLAKVKTILEKPEVLTIS